MTKITITEQEFTTFYNKLSISQLSGLLGVNRLTIFRTAKQYGLSKGGLSKPKLVLDPTNNKTLPDGTIMVTPAQFTRLYSLMSTQKLAAFYGVTRMTIYRKAKQLNLTKSKLD